MLRSTIRRNDQKHSLLCNSRKKKKQAILTICGVFHLHSTAWIGSIAFALVFFAGPLAGSLSDRFGCRVVCIAGGLMCSVALFLSSFATNIVHYYFTYSLLFGLGGCCVRTSCFLITAKYFHKRRSLATGILSAAAGIGLFIFGPFTQLLLDVLGLAGTYRVLAIPCLAICVCALTFHSNVQAEGTYNLCEIPNEEDCDTRKIIDCSVWREPVFVVLVITFMIGVLGIVVPPLHLVSSLCVPRFHSCVRMYLSIYLSIYLSTMEY